MPIYPYRVSLVDLEEVKTLWFLYLTDDSIEDGLVTDQAGFILATDAESKVGALFEHRQHLFREAGVNLARSIVGPSSFTLLDDLAKYGDVEDVSNAQDVLAFFVDSDKYAKFQIPSKNRELLYSEISSIFETSDILEGTGTNFVDTIKLVSDLILENTRIEY